MARDEFILELLTKFKPDEDSMNSIKKSFDTFEKVELFSDKDEQFVSSLRETFNTFEASKSMLSDLSKTLEQYKAAQGMGEWDEDEMTESIRQMMTGAIGDNPELAKAFGDMTKTAQDKFIGNVKGQILAKAEQLGMQFLQGIANAFKDAWNELENIMQSSFMTNQTTRENMFAYGMSAAESYGFEQAKSMLGIQSEEDLWYMTEQQRQQFQRVMTKYADKYNKLADSGFFETMLDYQIEMEEFKKDMQLSIVEFIMNNKDTIKSFMKMTMQFLKVIMEGVNWLVDKFTDRRTTDEEKAANIDSILNSYVQNNRSMTVNQTNNFNGTSGQFIDSSINQLTAQTTEALKAFGE